MATTMIADNSFTRIRPRQLQHYLLRTTYKPQTWLTFAGTTNILESRDNVQTVNHLEHNRDFSFGTSVSPSDRWSLDQNYAYDSVYSNTLECYTASTTLTPYAHLAFDLAPGWTWKADYNYYSYGEGTPIGPTLPRSFRGNVYTLGVRYAF